MRKAFHVLSIIMAGISTAIFTLCGVYYTNLPENYVLNSNFSNKLQVSSITSLKYTNKLTQKASIQNIESKNYDAQLMLFDVIPIKNATVTVADRKYVIPCGIPFGIKIYTEGVLVIKTGNIDTSLGTVNPAEKANIQSGDIILLINGQKIKNNEDMQNIIKNSDGSSLDIQLKRNNLLISTTLTPVLPIGSQEYKAGIWVRDSTAGIGTLTYYDAETHTFGGLGHGICDNDTEQLMPLQSGEIVKATINSIRKSTSGVPGSLCGSFLGSQGIGNLKSNTEAGVYGTMEQSPSNLAPIPVANRYEIQTGSAKVLTTIDGEKPQYYDIEIESVNCNDKNETKNMIIRITDEKLIEKTGGIVQGMSGSPIIQNGMLIGAVTHVFINDTQRGYAIFAENMLVNNNIIVQTELPLAS